MQLKDIFNHKPRKRYITLPAQSNNAPSLNLPVTKRCPQCGGRRREEDLDLTLKVCPDCNYHYPLSAGERLWITADEDSFQEFDAGMTTVDPLAFPGYEEKIAIAQEETCLKEAVVTGQATINGQPVVLGVMEGHFMMGSMGSVVGEKIARAFEQGLERSLPVIIFTASGGARMQEGMYSLMQMAKTSAAAARFAKAGLLYISVLTHPTTGGVTASFATLGDVILTEPGTLVCFTGPRVIEQTIKQKLPEGFQQAEFLLSHGMIDRIVHRQELKDFLSKLVSLHETGESTHDR
jgi:acetyl-CoA carboxylase carboxyl transferase subunit beta